MRATLLTLIGVSLDEALEYFSLADLWALIESELYRRGSILDRAINPDMSQWGITELLLRKLIHAVEVGNWIAAGGRKSGSRQPKPLPLPNEISEEREALTQDDAIPMDEAKARLHEKYST